MDKVFVYDPELVVVKLDNVFITGFSEDDKISIEKNADNTLPKVGSDGKVHYSINADKTATMTITLMSTSPSLPHIRNLARTQRDFPLSLVNMNDNGENISCDKCRIIKEPAIELGKEADSVDIEIFIPYLNA